MKEKKPENISKECSQMLLAINDTMVLLSGKWKIQIIGVLTKKEKLRFMDLLREVHGIAAKMLSKELQELEVNELVKRTVCNTKPVTVEYEITSYGKTLDKIIIEIARWGIKHRKRLYTKA